MNTTAHNERSTKSSRDATSDMLARNLVERACPACGDTAGRGVLTDRNRREGLHVSGTYKQCSPCGMVYLSPAPSSEALDYLYGQALIDAVPEEVVSAIGPPGSNEPPPGLARRLQLLFKGRPHSEPLEEGRGRRILDFGCLEGRKLVEFRDRGWHVTGLDLNEKAIAKAKCRIPDGEFFCQDLADFHPPEKFDAIRTDNVVEHLLEPGPTLARLRDLLKPGGQLIIMVPNARALSVRMFGRFSINYWIPYHLNLFTTRSLHQLLERVGFRDVSVETFSPNRSIVLSLRQLIAAPGFLCRSPTAAERMLLVLGLGLYPLELLGATFGAGEELIARAVR